MVERFCYSRAGRRPSLVGNKVCMSQSSARKRGLILVLVVVAVALLALGIVLAALAVRGIVQFPVQSQAALDANTPTPSATYPIRSTSTPMPSTSTRRPVRTPRSTPAHGSATPARQLPTTTPSAGRPARCEELEGTVIDGAWFSQVSGGEEQYLIYLPPCYERDLNFRYPTLYLLHGIDNDDTMWESLGIFMAMNEGLQAGKLAPAIVVLPDGNYDLFVNTSGGPGSYAAQIVDELIPSVDHLYRTDARNTMRAIGGISRGGVWSLEIGFDNPDLFGVVAGHSPCLYYNEVPPMLDPLKMTLKLSLKRQRIWLDAGDADGCLPDTEDMHAALDSVEVSHAYYVWPGSHMLEYWAAHLSDYLEFYTQTWPKP